MLFCFGSWLEHTLHEGSGLGRVPAELEQLCKGATIMPGISVGKHAIVGAGAVVTKDVPDCAVAVGNPAKVIKMLDPNKFA